MYYTANIFVQEANPTAETIKEIPGIGSKLSYFKIKKKLVFYTKKWNTLFVKELNAYHVANFEQNLKKHEKYLIQIDHQSIFNQSYMTKMI